MNFDHLKSDATAWASQSLSLKLTPPNESALFNAFEALNTNDSFLLSVIEELLMNGIEHGHAPIETFIVHQNSTVLFGIWDQGIGIHQTLPNNPKLADTKDKTSAALVRLSLEEYITGTSQVGRGIGLSLLTKYVERSDSQLLIWSNGAWVMQQKNYFFEQPSSQEINGTMILLSVPRG